MDDSEKLIEKIAQTAVYIYIISNLKALIH